MQNAVIFSRPTISPSILLSDLEKFESLLRSAKNILFKIGSVFPFDFFPDHLTIDTNKVNIVYSFFFFSKDIHSIAIDAIRDIEVETSVLFATLKIVPDGYPGHPLEVHYLWKKDAIRARKIIQGLMIARKKGIDPEKLDLEDLVDKVAVLGGTNLVE